MVCKCETGWLRVMSEVLRVQQELVLPSWRRAASCWVVSVECCLAQFSREWIIRDRVVTEGVDDAGLCVAWL